MRKSDWLDVGLKILGVYFLILGIREVLNAVVVLTWAADRGPVPSPGWGVLLAPLLELGAALLLIFVSWKVSEPHGLVNKEPVPENLVDVPESDPERPDEPFWQKKK